MELQIPIGLYAKSIFRYNLFGHSPHNILYKNDICTKYYITLYRHVYKYIKNIRWRIIEKKLYHGDNMA